MSNEVTIRITSDDDTGKGFASAKQRAKSDGLEIGKSLGQSASRMSMSTISEGMSGLGSAMSKSPHVLAAGAAVGAVLAPAIGAALNSAMLLGAGGGVLAAGIAAAAQSPRVKSAFKAFKDSASDMFKDFGTPFIAPLERGIFTLRRGLDDISPSLNRMGASMAPLIDKLAPALADMARNAMPGIERAVAASVPLFEKLGEHLPRLGAAIGDFFDSMADGAPGALKFFDFFLTTIENTIRMLGLGIEGASRLFDVMAKGMGGDLKGAMESAAGYMMMLDEETKKTAEGQDGFAESTSGAARAAQKEASSLQDVISKMATLGRLTLTERDAQRGLIESLEEATAALRKNGATLQVGTAKGRENAAAIDEVANRYLSLAESQMRTDKSGARANRTMQEGANVAFFQARRFGASAAAALNYSQKLFGIPPTRQTLIQLANVEKARGNLAGYRDIMAQIPRTITTTVTTHYRQIGGASTPRQGHAADRGFAHGGIVGAAASGGIRSGMTLVGEHGPELVKLPPGSHVTPAGTTRSMYSAANEILARMRQGKSFNEDWTWGSSSKNVGAHNDTLLAMFEKAGGDSGNRKQAMKWLSSLRMTPAAMRAGAAKPKPKAARKAPAARSTKGLPTLVIDVRGGEEDFKRLIRKWVRVEGGNVQLAFGRG